jgi:hypothetical protein
LRGVKMDRAVLRGADFTGAHLQSANLRFGTGQDRAKRISRQPHSTAPAPRHARSGERPGEDTTASILAFSAEMRRPSLGGARSCNRGGETPVEYREPKMNLATGFATGRDSTCW